MPDSQKVQPKITAEQLQQLLAMQGGASTAKPTPTKKQAMIHKAFSKIVHFMQRMTIFLDLFVNFITKKTDGARGDVLQAARSPIIFGTYIILVFVVFGGIWSAIAPLNSAAVAVGTVIANSNKKIIQHQEGGIIKNIFVHQGDRVAVGDTLVELEETKIKVQYENVLHQYRTVLATENRLVAERDGLDKIEFSEFLTKDRTISQVEKMIHTQENLFRSKKDMYRAEKESLNQKLAQYNKQIEGLEAKKIALIKNLDVINDRLKATNALYDKNFVQKSVLLELEAKQAGAKSEAAMVDIDIAKTHQEITRTDIEIINLQHKYTKEVLSELKEVQVQVATLREQLNSAQDSLERVTIQSPVDGIVNVLYNHTIGGVIRAGEAILEISPLNDTLIIEAKVSHKNIDAIHVGLIAKIRFSAFKSRTTPLFTGKVVSISPDTVQDRNQNQSPDQNAPYYIARIEIDADEFTKLAKAKKLELHQGMQAEVQIVTGTRTLLRYMLDPVTDVMFRAFREK